MTKYNDIYSKLLQYPLNKNKNISEKYLKINIALHFQELLPIKTAKYGKQIKFMTTRHIFS